MVGPRPQTRSPATKLIELREHPHHLLLFRSKLGRDLCRITFIDRFTDFPVYVCRFKLAEVLAHLRFHSLRILALRMKLGGSRIDLSQIPPQVLPISHELTPELATSSA